MANPFDQFDAPSSRSASPAPAPAGNPFDRFDTPAARRDEPAPDRFALGDVTSAGADASAEPLAQGMRRVADERLVGRPSGANQRDAALFSFVDSALLNIPRNVAAGLQSVRTGEEFGTVYDRMKGSEEALARQYPKTALAGMVGGIVGGAVSLPAIPARAGAGIVGRGMANLATGAAYGGVAEGFDKHTAADAFQGAAIGGATGAAGGALLDAGAWAYRAVSKADVPFRDAMGNLTERAASALREVGIDPAAVTPEIEAAFAAKGPSPAVAREAAASEFGIPLSRGQATLDPRALELETSSLSGSRGGRAQAIGAGFDARQSAAIDAARGQLQGMAARGSDLIDSPTGAFEAVADRARAVGGRYADDAARAQAERDAALQAVRGPGSPDSLEGATAAVEGLRDAAGQRRAAYGAAYDDLDAIEGTFAPSAFARAGERIRGMIGPDVPIAPDVTPAAARALAMIDDLPRSFGLRPDQGPTLQQVNAIRKGISRLHGSTGQNGSDRYALGAVREAFDRHVQDMAEIGQFRAAGAGPGGGGAAGGDDLFSARIPRSAVGDAGEVGARVESPPPNAIMLPPARQGEPESMMRFLARTGGVPLDAETRAGDLNRVYMPGFGTLARRNAPTWDQIRVRLAEGGFLPTDAEGYAGANGVRDFVLDALHQERIGRGARTRMGDEMAGPGAREAERVADQNADHAVMVDREARRLAIDLEPFGISGNTLDRAALREAAEARVLGQADDGVRAYDDAIARRGDGGGEGPQSGRAPDDLPDAPFPDLGEGVGPAGSTFPAGDTGPADAMRRARGLFSEYKRAFAPRGPGDVAGQRLQRIVERDASPNEAVSMLFGTTTGRIGGGQLQTLSRLREAVGADSEPWRAVQQSIIGRYVGGEPRDLASRLDYLLRGDGRQLASSFLTSEQRAGLVRLRAAVSQAEHARAAMPTWLADVERGGFDPNRIASSLFGSGVPGARPGAVNEARAAKGFLGEGSQEWSMLRQAAVQRVTGAADQSVKAGRIVDQVRAFTDGPGAGLARELFSVEELGQMRRFAAALHSTLRPDGTMRPDAGGAAKMAAKALDVLAGAVAFKAGGPAAGIGAYGAKVGQRALIGGVGAARARRSFEGGAPRERLPAPYLPTDRLAVGSGLYTGQ